jgi:hypothetical protein
MSTITHSLQQIYFLSEIYMRYKWDTVKPILRGHLWEKETRGSALSWACVVHLSFCFEET